MRCYALFIAALLIGCCASESTAQQRYYSTTQFGSRSRPQVSYYVDITPRPVRTRTLSGMNVPPHNPIFDGGGRALSRQPIGRTSGRASGYHSRTAGSSIPTYSLAPTRPQLIINPFVDQKGYEHLGRSGK